MRLYADLHIHSPFALAVSKHMLPEQLLVSAQIKGIRIIGTGDGLHPGWRRLWREHLVNQEEICVVPTAEVEGLHRIHHLILMEDDDQCAALHDLLKPFSTNIDRNGRPHVRLDGEEIAAHVHAVGGMIGPAHAFTPWTSIYATYDHIRDCYGDEPIDLLELGLSADSSYGAGISELDAVPFISNSDAHSPQTNKFGREFNLLDQTDLTPRGVFSALKERRVLMNAGFFPEEGKYNRTACVGGLHQYTLEEAIAYKWRCPVDGARIKKGVADRARELTDGPPSSRPPYLHLIPLSEIIQRVLGTASPSAKKVQQVYNEYIAQFGNEIAVLIEASESEICAIHPLIGAAVQALRDGRVELHPGGGGSYGSFSFIQ
jgi:uncharacterized protein (TIGR00375 family)